MKFQVTALNTYGEIITRKEKKKKKKWLSLERLYNYRGKFKLHVATKTETIPKTLQYCIFTTKYTGNSFFSKICCRTSSEVTLHLVKSFDSEPLSSVRAYLMLSFCIPINL